MSYWKIIDISCYYNLAYFLKNYILGLGLGQRDYWSMHTFLEVQGTLSCTLSCTCHEFLRQDIVQDSLPCTISRFYAGNLSFLLTTQRTILNYCDPSSCCQAIPIESIGLTDCDFNFKLPHEVCCLIIVIAGINLYAQILLDSEL